MRINKFILNKLNFTNDELIDEYDINKNLSIQSNQKFEELSILYEDDSLYNKNYNKLINIYNDYIKKELVLKENLFVYKTRLLKGEELNIEEKKDIRSKKDLRKNLLLKIDQIKIKLNNNKLCQKDQSYTI